MINQIQASASVQHPSPMGRTWLKVENESAKDSKTSGIRHPKTTQKKVLNTLKKVIQRSMRLLSSWVIYIFNFGMFAGQVWVKIGIGTVGTWNSIHYIYSKNMWHNYQIDPKYLVLMGLKFASCPSISSIHLCTSHSQLHG